MNRSAAVAFCNRYANKYFYQPVIFVPGSIEIQGKWNKQTKELANLCFQNVAGKSVLDLGCNIGFFLREALKRGARKAVGVDHDPIEIDIAHEITNIMQDQCCFHCEKIENFQPYDCDLVLMLNVLHVVENPELLISRYIAFDLIIEHLESQMKYFPCSPDKTISSPRCYGYRMLSFFGSSFKKCSL